MNLPLKVNEREKRFLVMGGIVVILIIAFYIISWYSDTKKNIREISDAKLFMLQKQMNKISEKEYIESKYKAVKQELERQEKMLLRGNTPPVAAAALQKFLKETASSLDIDVKLERALNLVDAESYLAIPVEIGFTASTRQLKDLLLKLRKSPFLITVSEIKVRVTNISKPEDIYTTLVVHGVIKKAPEKETDKKEEKSVT
jgi:Tfp pilus assembly protein PilN